MWNNETSECSPWLLDPFDQDLPPLNYVYVALDMQTCYRSRLSILSLGWILTKPPVFDGTSEYTIPVLRFLYFGLIEYPKHLIPLQLLLNDLGMYS